MKNIMLLTIGGILLLIFVSNGQAQATCSCDGETGYRWTNSRTVNPTRGGCAGKGTQIDETVFIAPTAKVCKSASVMNSARIYGNALVTGQSIIRDSARVFGNAIVKGDAILEGRAIVSGNAIVGGSAIIRGKSIIRGYTEIYKGEVSEGIRNDPISKLGNRRNNFRNAVAYLNNFKGYKYFPARSRLRSNERSETTSILKLRWSSVAEFNTKFVVSGCRIAIDAMTVIENRSRGRSYLYKDTLRGVLDLSSNVDVKIKGVSHIRDAAWKNYETAAGIRVGSLMSNRGLSYVRYENGSKKSERNGPVLFIFYIDVTEHPANSFYRINNAFAAIANYCKKG